MKKINRWLISIGLVAVIGGAGYYVFHDDVRQPISQVKTVTNQVKETYSTDPDHFVLKPYQVSSLKEKDDLLDHFLIHDMLIGNSFVTNYKASRNQSKSELATGHDRLSESSGIWLRHLALAGMQKEYDDFYKKTKQAFFADGQFSYRINADGTRSSVNASVDDMRIIRSLVEAQARFHDDKYSKEINTLLKTFTKQSIQDGLLVDFYDTKSKKASDEVSLYYLSIKELGYIYKKAGLPLKNVEYQYQILKNGYISDKFPFYHKNYQKKKKKYVDGDSINVIESLLSILYLSEIGEEKEESIQFIRDAVTTGTLYNAYNEDGVPVDRSQSAASYAIAAMIAREIDDEKLYRQAMNIVSNFQIMDKNSPIYGGIGDQNTLEVYSFNNLMSALAYDY